MKRFVASLLVLLLSIAALSSQEQKRLAVQYSTFDALSAGLYDTNFEIGQLRQYGDSGLGTFENLDGEMILLDGSFFQIKADGNAFAVSDSVKTPFANVCIFKQDIEIPIKKDMTFTEIKNEIMNSLPSKNAIYAIRIEGRFKTMTTRSVPAQETPFLPLADVLKQQQKIRKVLRMRGDIVGFYFPPMMKGICIENIHMHFIAADKKSGGHVLDFVIEVGNIRIGEMKEFLLLMPQTETFRKLDFKAASKAGESAMKSEADTKLPKADEKKAVK